MKKEMRIESKINLGNYENITISMAEEFTKDDNWDEIRIKLMDEFKKQSNAIVTEWKENKNKFIVKDSF